MIPAIMCRHAGTKSTRIETHYSMHNIFHARTDFVNLPRFPRLYQSLCRRINVFLMYESIFLVQTRTYTPQALIHATGHSHILNNFLHNNVSNLWRMLRAVKVHIRKWVVWNHSNGMLSWFLCVLSFNIFMTPCVGVFVYKTSHFSLRYIKCN